ncbi:MAG: hypothetical protein CMK59_06210 [Proteobacteria bacterium]|nr:hypothetical protein [Pseudomonadota bacterium]
MNIILIPYTWMRHFQPALWCGFFGAIAWWLFLSWFLLVGPFWAPSFDGTMWCSLLAISVSGGMILSEANLYRWPFRRRLWKLITVASASFGLVLLFNWFFILLLSLILNDPDVQNPYVVSLKLNICTFVSAGLATGFSVQMVRGWQSWFTFLNYIISGLNAGILAALAWSLFHSFLPQSALSAYLGYDLFWSGLISNVLFGVLFGLGSWTIPDELYAGWLRILSTQRFGHRVPIDAGGGAPKERFVGHYPNGLDLFLPFELGVQELHISVHKSQDNEFILRGLSQEQTRLKRIFEWVNIHYDPNRPAPYEASLKAGDQITLGESAKLEFLILPREER